MSNYSVQYSSLIKKNVVITGGATGIGSVIAKYFYNQGSQVIILDIKKDDAGLLIKSMPSGKKFLQPEFFYCDLTDTEKISQVFLRYITNMVFWTFSVIMLLMIKDMIGKLSHH